MIKFIAKLLYTVIIAQAAAVAFSTTNVNFLYGNFNDNSYVYDVKDSGKSTFTLEHYSANRYGDVFFFTDLTRANKSYKYQNKRNDWYFELSPRISLNLLQNSFIKNTYLAFQYNKGAEYEAILAGVGVGLNLPFFTVFDINIYRKKQNIGDTTIQLSSNYYVPLPQKFHFEGFLDKTKEDFLTQNQLLYDITKNFFIGTEWHYYTTDNVKSSTFQYLLKYRW